MIADGAAFGPEMDRVMRLIEVKDDAALYLPKSFEWLILSSGILKDNEIGLMLEEPSAYIESRKYFSWERFFTALLVEKAEGTYLAYSKKTLNKAYLNEHIKEAVLARMNRIMPDWNKG